ncbi:MAG TPA: bifunctional proline dehydrogenase/L-glutamate gamma-semialdehyde dehydrogenase PutA [Sphingomonadales bacterium]|nr:bifunctional proline dehydrogenase/L-glutamate gamma-semialdehyde dehydrogenase PutA [Sphingomonadales bacterium]
MPPPFVLDTARRVLREAKLSNEEKGLEDLQAAYPLSASQQAAAAKKAGTIVEASRAMKDGRGTLDAFLQEFGLSNQEGVALMCLAEALLRIPDAETQDALIAEKMKKGKWADHAGKSEDFLVNASVWGLMLTGGVVKLDRELANNPAAWVGKMVSRVGEPVIRGAVLQAMKILGRQFVFGRTMEEALSRKAKEPADRQLFSFDMLGEGARTEAAARRYQQLYLASIEAVGRDGKGRNVSHLERSSVSIKLSALHPRYEAVKEKRVRDELLPRVKALAMRAKTFDMGLTIDAEEADRLEPSLDVLEALARDPDLKGWQGLGLAVQAYQKRAPYLIEWLTALAHETGRQFPVRLVKGAYWDTEIKRAQEQGLADYPVWTRKATTDLCYLVTAKKMLQADGAIYPQFATHNAHTIAAITAMAGGKPFEFQRLHGMGEVLYRAAEKTLPTQANIRTYAPVGAHEDLLPYLVRRLLENGANSSFVNRFMDSRVPVDGIVRDPFFSTKAYRTARHARIPKPVDLYGDRKNSAGIDLSSPLERGALVSALAKLSREKYDGAAIINGKALKGKAADARSPADFSDIVGAAVEAPPKEMEAALHAAHAAGGDWDALGGGKRAAILEKAAGFIEEERERLISLLVREGGKTLNDAISEVREAADYCRYYAKEARVKFAEPLPLKGPTGEANRLSLHGRGAFLCISPWNFPLAIFLGQVTAALASGNSVLAKPAGQTPLIAAEGVRILHRAGVPASVLHLIVGSGSAVGRTLAANRLTAGVALTGSTATAKIINRTLAEKEGPIVPFIAETGGQNAMIVDSSALPEQVADDVMTSAFSSAGQRCSALRVLYLQEEVAEKMIEMLAGALAEREIGHPADPATDIGPVIDANARQELEAHAARMEKEGRLIAATPMPKGLNGSYFAPRMFEIPALRLLHDEVFGPILHVIRYRAKDIAAVLGDIRATGYGLTFGIHSRIEGRWHELFSGIPAGNTYVNRSMIGAVVGVQPFGGQGLSGTGPKAGGPHYLARFATEKTLSINTAAIGGNTDLFSLEEDGD